jgi:hypothetical protein
VEQDRVALEIQEFPLALTEAAHVHDALSINARSSQRRLVRTWRDNQLPRVLEANEAPIK